ncbi:hypothetical protein BDV95DRAFT_490249 [Massariosphaeria phaeospora]|uniref:Uncharacterized protein n=1 Tax=Massariosphaeria phaeospora TaxID=100035 RepID=A0A7C8IHS6_9PLEO|nr:hypothetical protein BDV95DRAFT_490249 [Massariosphaeria phaeospora]
MSFIITRIVTGVSTSIGLAAEKYYDRKDRKIALQEFAETATADNGRITGDERDWALDDAAEETFTQRPTEEATIADLVHDTIPAPSSAHAANAQLRLAYPIIIPQRRPGTKARGFARAYAPDLEAFGIDQNTFLRFLKNFQAASQASPFLNALTISAGIASSVPATLTFAVPLAVSIIAGTAIELQGRYKANAYLDQINKELFMPLGLYAMVLVYRSDDATDADEPTLAVETVNMETAKHITKWGLPEGATQPEGTDSGSSKTLRPIRGASGKTKGDAMMPLEVAPLIYPGLDTRASRPELSRDESFKQRLQRNKKFVGEYYDRRAAASYTGNNPETLLAKSTAEASFRSRFADPNHPVNNGTPTALLTGGNVRGIMPVRETGEDGRLMPKEKYDVIKLGDVRGPIGLVGYGLQGVQKVLGSDVMYLTVVNMPSEEELEEARRVLRDKKGFATMLKAFLETKEA